MTIIHREKNMKNNKLKDKDKQKMCGRVKVSCSNYSTPENTMDKNSRDKYRTEDDVMQTALSVTVGVMGVASGAGFDVAEGGLLEAEVGVVSVEVVEEVVEGVGEGSACSVCVGG